MEDYFRVVSPGWPVRRKLSIIGENRHFTNDPVLSEIDSMTMSAPAPE